MVENSDIIEKLLTTLFNISSRKTTQGHAYSVMDSVIRQLESEYDFLRHVELKDTRFLEDATSISVMKDMNSIHPDRIGKAIESIILNMDKRLGKRAGYFFIKELSRNIGEEYSSTMRDMGVDLSLLQLQKEVNELEKRMFNKNIVK